MRSIPPIKDSVKAKHHTPMYTVHRYFARRPHNVFANIINHYSDGKKITVLDPFSGGGVTLIEALTHGHKAIGYEINELAAFIIENELRYVPEKELLSCFKQCLALTQKKIGKIYSLNNSEFYWWLWVSVAICPSCEHEMNLSPDTAVGSGVYKCTKCKNSFRPKRVSSTDIKVIDSCVMDAGGSLSGLPKNLQIHAFSKENLEKHMRKCDKEIERLHLSLDSKQKTPIPECNLEKESALHKKNFLYFEDFFSPRAHAWIQAFATSIFEVTDDEAIQETLLYLLSASLRYISRFSSLNEGWRGNYKPLEWAKSNFWTPYSFVEFNPFLAIWDRYKSYQKALGDIEKRFPEIKPKKGTVKKLKANTANYVLINKSSQNMPELDDDSIDLILTDPPYGSYVHYGELSGFWLAWLKKFHKKFEAVKILKKDEALVSRKKHKNFKTFASYESILTEIFSECWRVLKEESYLVLTFNNKEPEAWLALLKAIKKAGFYLPEGGVTFQDGVETYKRTIDLRRNGAIHGDFIYSFQKKKKKFVRQATTTIDWKKQLHDILDEICSSSDRISNSDLYLKINFALIPRLYQNLNPNDASGLENGIEELSLSNIEKIVKEYLNYDAGFWLVKSTGMALSRAS